MRARLYRSRDDRILAGVAGGVAEYFDLDPSLVRIVWALLAFAGGFGLLLYIVMAIVVPEEPWTGEQPWAQSPDAGPAAAGMAATGIPATGPGPAPGTTASPPDWRAQRAAERAARRADRRAGRDDSPRTAALVIGGLFVLAGIGFLAREVFPAITFDYFWPLVLVAVGVVVLATAFRGDHRGTPPAPPAPPAGGSDDSTGRPGATP
jgi:phage shock protein PspC (stress-responsive transcriptional regulator)